MEKLYKPSKEEKRQAREVALRLYGQVVRATNGMSIAESDID